MQLHQRNNMNNRNALFGSSATGGNNAYRQDRNQAFSDETQRMYEEQNNREIDALGDKIASLKDVALNINMEVKSHNNLLDGMDGQMGNVDNLMRGALRQLDAMINSGGSKHMCYLVLFIVGVFLVLYMLLSWR